MEGELSGVGEESQPREPILSLCSSSHCSWTSAASLSLKSCSIVASLCADVTARLVRTSCGDADDPVETAAAAAPPPPLSSQPEKNKA